MTAFQTSIATRHASKYLQQLCKHFAHKVTVQYSPEEGRVAFPPGRCLMNAGAEELTFYCLAREDRAVPVIKSILDQHLTKFAWREELSYDWYDGLPDTIAEELSAVDFLPAESTKDAS